MQASKSTREACSSPIIIVCLNTHRFYCLLHRSILFSFQQGFAPSIWFVFNVQLHAGRSKPPASQGLLSGATGQPQQASNFGRGVNAASGRCSYRGPRPALKRCSGSWWCSGYEGPTCSVFGLKHTPADIFHRYALGINLYPVSRTTFTNKWSGPPEKAREGCPRNTDMLVRLKHTSFHSRPCSRVHLLRTICNLEPPRHHMSPQGLYSNSANMSSGV